MPDKIENATLLLQLGLPATLIHLYPHKKIAKRNFLKTLSRVEQFENETFFLD